MNKLLTINSINRRNGTSTNFYIQINKPIKFNHISLESAQIPVTFYNINSSNNSFNINEGAGDTLITINPGSYNISDLVTQLSIKINSAGLGGAYTITYNGSTFKISIQSTIL